MTKNGIGGHPSFVYFISSVCNKNMTTMRIYKLEASFAPFMVILEY